MKILLASPLGDNQSGIYLRNSLIDLGNKVAIFDWRSITDKADHEELNSQFIEAHKQLTPDLTLIIKGLGITGETIKKIREFHKGKLVGWIFDVTLGGIMVKNFKPYIDFIKELDTFYTIDNDAVPELKALGVNAKWLTEGCYPPEHQSVLFNQHQQKLFGADIVFLGSIGDIHHNREKILERIDKEGFNFKIFGDVLYEPDKEPEWVKRHHTGYEAINDYHSIACEASKIVIGIDGWPERSKSWSARLYRTLCAGGFYLTNYTKDMENYFKPGEVLDVYHNEDELIEKILYYLNNDNERTRISEAGKKLVNEKHTFAERLKEICE
jgi:spore maturation protein CgeB